MASSGRRQASTLEEQLFTEGPLFDFYQAVALIERLAAKAAEVGAGADPSMEALRFASNPKLSFAATEIERIVPRDSETASPTMFVNFMGVMGATGPLPLAFAEHILSHNRRRDSAALDFLDIFHHRLVSLAYRIHKRHHMGLGVTSPVGAHIAKYLYAFMGLSTPGLMVNGDVSETRRDSLTQRDTNAETNASPDATGFAFRTFLHYSGLLASEVRTMSGLEALLSNHFGVTIEGTPLVGGYYSIEPEQRTRIGNSGQNRILGQSAIIGIRYWDQEACFELTIGPLNVADYIRFLPGGDRLAPLCKLTRFYTGNTTDFRVRLILHSKNSDVRDSKARNLRPKSTTQTLSEHPCLGRTVWAGEAWLRKDTLLMSSSLPAPEGG